MQDSIAADTDYQSWMRDFATAKNAFVAIWDPMAPRCGQRVCSSTEF